MVIKFNEVVNCGNELLKSIIFNDGEIIHMEVGEYSITNIKKNILYMGKYNYDLVGGIYG